MAPKKKKKRPEAAQQLIDSLLDEKTPIEGVILPVTFSNSPLESDDDDEKTANVEFGELSLDDGSSAPPFDGTQPLVTQMSQDPKVDLELSLGDIELSQPKLTQVADEPVQSESIFNLPVDSNDSPDVGDDEQTVKLSVQKKSKQEFNDELTPVPNFERNHESIVRGAETEIKTGFKPPPEKAAFVSPAFSSSEAALKQSESLRIAQNRMLELEAEIEKLRRGNEELASAGDTLRRRTDELLSRAENVENQSREVKRIAEEEKKVLRGQLQAKERENSEIRARLEEIETRLESGFKKIRVRERELEHRLEIVKMESATLVSTKDRMILELKRQVDQLHHEADHGKQKSQELFNQYKEKQETIRRVVRALRIALTILEGDEDAVVPLKKAE
ncbi:MAG TPA: hypothetical protein VM432_12450 [Bdellovibrionales bacterium]|nr:hypothetical protein [Bdellovibrionales bacterium]